jgi:hypothetical protein
MFAFEMSKGKNEKTKLGKLIKIRLRDDGVVVFYREGSPRMGVRCSPATEAMFKAIESVYEDAVALEVSI